jgi:hypothetical protein
VHLDALETVLRRWLPAEPDVDEDDE